MLPCLRLRTKRFDCDIRGKFVSTRHDRRRRPQRALALRRSQPTVASTTWLRTISHACVDEVNVKLNAWPSVAVTKHLATIEMTDVVEQFHDDRERFELTPYYFCFSAAAMTDNTWPSGSPLYVERVSPKRPLANMDIDEMPSRYHCLQNTTLQQTIYSGIFNNFGVGYADLPPHLQRGYAEYISGTTRSITDSTTMQQPSWIKIINNLHLFALITDVW